MPIRRMKDRMTRADWIRRVEIATRRGNSSKWNKQSIGINNIMEVMKARTICKKRDDAEITDDTTGSTSRSSTPGELSGNQRNACFLSQVFTLKLDSGIILLRRSAASEARVNVSEEKGLRTLWVHQNQKQCSNHDQPSGRKIIKTAAAAVLLIAVTKEAVSDKTLMSHPNTRSKKKTKDTQRAKRKIL